MLFRVLHHPMDAELHNIPGKYIIKAFQWGPGERDKAGVQSLSHQCNTRNHLNTAPLHARTLPQYLFHVTSKTWPEENMLHAGLWACRTSCIVHQFDYARLSMAT